MCVLHLQPPGITSVLPPPLLPPVAPEPEEETGAFHDPILDRGAAGRRGERRRRAGFDFVQEGRFQREAELFRCGQCRLAERFSQHG